MSRFNVISLALFFEDSHFECPCSLHVGQQWLTFSEHADCEVQLQAKLLMPADARQLRFVYQTLLAGKPGLCVYVCVLYCGVAEQKDVWHVFPHGRKSLYEK